jgi:superoxide dismutase
VTVKILVGLITCAEVYIWVCVLAQVFEKEGLLKLMKMAWNEGKPLPVFNNVAQVVNHTMFWWVGMASVFFLDATRRPLATQPKTFKKLLDGIMGMGMHVKVGMSVS